MTKQQNDSEGNLVLVLGSGLFLGFGLVLGLGSVLGLGFGLVLGSVLGLGLVSVLVSVLGLGLDEREFELIMLFYIIGLLIGGFMGYQQAQIQSLQTNVTTTTIPPSTYQGIVQAIYTDHPSYVKFTSGDSWYGNISRIANLSIGSVCTLEQNMSIQKGYFTSGTCYTR